MKIQQIRSATPQSSKLPAVLFCVVAFLLWDRLRPDKTPPPRNFETNTLFAMLAQEPEKARALASFYDQFAGVVERDSEAELISSLSEFRTAHGRALTLAFQGTSVVNGTKVGKQIDAELEEAMGGLQDREVDQETRGDLARALRGISWKMQNSPGGNSGG